MNECFKGTAQSGPSFCWHCNRQLRRAPGKGMFYFVNVVDPDGNYHRVHGRCADESALNGNRIHVGFNAK